VTTPTVDIVIAVRRDPAVARRCLASVLAARNVTRYEAIVVLHPDVDAAAIELRDPRVTLLRDDRAQNLADVVNRAFALHADRDVVVLQADAEVSGDWLDRLAAHADFGVAVVGTFTNAAGAATYARPSHPNAAGAATYARPSLGQAGAAEPDAARSGAERTGAADAGEALDALFARVNAGRFASVAAAHGPCLYFTRAGIVAVGAMKAIATADGHAAEIDYSLRARAAGYEARVAGDVYVQNDGEGSFGGRGGALATDAAAKTLANLHPEYDGRVAAAEADALRLFAGRVDIARLATSTRPAILFVAHAWGGGIRRHIDDLATLLRERVDVYALEPAGGATVKLSGPHGRDGVTAWFRLPGDLALLAHTLRTIGVVRLHFHHVHGLPQSILGLPEATGVPYDCTLHDYYAICPQYHLAGADGRYCGEPDEAGCAACIAGRPAQWGLDIAAWRRTLGAFVRGAARVIAPSHDVAGRIGRYLPGVVIDVWPHPEREQRVPPGVVRVVTLGNLSPEKGLDVVRRCADDARRRGLPLVFRVLGATTEPIAQSPDAPLTIHGSYDEAMLPQLLGGERADVLFFPAQVPETYAYTLSVALATPLPIVASALGALPERLAGRARTLLIAWDATPEQWNAALLEAARAPGAVAVAPAVDATTPAGPGSALVRECP
jgi:glycosyltransferase involved in cell wall biosynthesis